MLIRIPDQARLNVMQIAVCTLFEGQDHHGVASLVNSLDAAGYRGTVWVGHQGVLPPWMLRRLEMRHGDPCLRVTSRVQMRMLELDVAACGTATRKPAFLLDVMRRLDPLAQALVYLEPGVVMKCPWHWMLHWLRPDGIALIEHADWPCAPTHPRQVRWRRFFATQGLAPVRSLDRFYGAGFIGVARDQLAWLLAWHRVCELFDASQAGRPCDATGEDLLNFSLSTCTTRLDTPGRAAMDVVPGARLPPHAPGPCRPWQGRHIRLAWHGEPPTPACRSFYRFAAGPVRSFSLATLWWRRAMVGIASLLGHIARPGPRRVSRFANQPGVRR